MPKEIELHLRGIDNLQLCYQTAKDLLTILQNPVVAKMSTLSLAQSRSPSPTLPRTSHHLLGTTDKLQTHLTDHNLGRDKILTVSNNTLDRTDHSQ